MSPADIICKKRDGIELSDEELSWFLGSYMQGGVAEEQMSAFAMAVVFQGMSERELNTWTRLYVESGEVLNWDTGGRPLVDKHSTGGVGDKVTLVLTPLAVACGLAVPQLSGRGLGHTGGTLDKLDAIKGWRSEIAREEMQEQMRGVGGMIVSASAEIAPADKRLYALRDVTGTVESIPLIAASIMGKKIAEGTSGLVLDVKVGKGAFMKTLEDGRALAKTMCRIGQANGVRTLAALTSMDQPLGRSAGNGVEVLEALECLNGGGPADLRELTLVLVEQMLRVGGVQGVDPEKVLNSGEAMRVFEEIAKAQGCKLPLDVAQSSFTSELLAERDGYVHNIDAMTVGVAAWRTGAGRARKEDEVQKGAGVVWEVGIGDYVRKGQVLAKTYSDNSLTAAESCTALSGAFDINAEVPQHKAKMLLSLVE
jgi:thymidine phosphorylase